MSDQTAMLDWVHRKNIERYGNLLKTNLSASERRFVEDLLAQEGAAMRRVKVAFQRGAKGHESKQTRDD
jgi:hypothetical protein